MKHIAKKSISLLLMLMLAMSFAVSAFAEGASITYKGKDSGFEFRPGSGYTNTDLFPNLKNVMPGDTLTETVTFKNEANDCDFVNLYLRAETNDPSYSETFENTDGKDQANIEGQRDESAATMSDFLSQLSMKVWNGTKLIYDASPDKTGGLTSNQLIGTFRKGETADLKVELTVPAELGNEYANRVGEVDWVFHVDAFSETHSDSHSGSSSSSGEPVNITVWKTWSGDDVRNRPDTVTVTLYNGDKAYDSVTLGAWNNWTFTWTDLGKGSWQVVETGVPAGYTPYYSVNNDVVTIVNTYALIQTGQLNWPIWVLAGAGIALIVGGVFILRKKKGTNA